MGSQAVKCDHIPSLVYFTVSQNTEKQQKKVNVGSECTCVNNWVENVFLSTSPFLKSHFKIHLVQF